MNPDTMTLVLSAVIALAGGAYGAKWAFGKDTEVEARRRAAFQLAGTLRVYGLNKIPEFLGDYAVGDYSGMFERIHDLAKLALSGESAIVTEFDQVYANVLNVKLATPEGRALLAAKLAAATPVAPEVPAVDMKLAVKS
jgi:hypothetical protein